MHRLFFFALVFALIFGAATLISSQIPWVTSIALPEEVVGSSIRVETTDIEETAGWTKRCWVFTDTRPPCDNPDIAILDSAVKQSGRASFKFVGTKTNQYRYEVSLPVKANALYKVGGRVKIKDRRCFNYLDLNYPSAIVSRKGRTKGIWCGEYALHLQEIRSDGAGALISFAPAGAYSSTDMLRHSDLDWFPVEGRFKTSPTTVQLKILIELRGFDGTLWLDALRLEEVASVIDDKYLHIPITYKFQGMQIRQVSTNPLFVETNAARFIFEGNKILLLWKGEPVGTLEFPPDSYFLRDLAVAQEPGLVILENSNVTISIGADSSIWTKLKRPVHVSVSGEKPTYHAFEAGVIFATDYEKGLFFAPVRPDGTIQAMVNLWHHDRNTNDYTWDDADFERVGLKNWLVARDFSQPTYAVRYTFGLGDGFVAAIFPPKEFDEVKYCKERFTIDSGSSLIFNRGLFYEPSFFGYYVQKLLEHANWIVLWSANYAVPANDQKPPMFYYEKNGQIVSPSTQGAVAKPLTPWDLAGPYAIREEASIRALVNEAHKQGAKVLVYMGYGLYYTEDIDLFLANLRENIEKFNFDGVYYDGVLLEDSLKSLELLRKTRNFLRQKLLLFHNSWDSYFIRRSNRLNAPLFGAYADKLFMGEGVKLTDDDIWRLNFSQQNVSNTVSLPVPEWRPVDYSRSAPENRALTMTPEQQIDKQLAFRGQFFANPLSYQSAIHDRFGNMTYDSRYYWDKLDAFCLSRTCGDNVCDTGETIYTCPADCAPITGDAVLKKVDDSTYTCQTSDSVAQWTVDGKPFYRLHFSFDGEIARDDSENRLSPSQRNGFPGISTPPRPAEIDGRKAFYFNGMASTYIFGMYDESLDFTGKDFSIFAALKRDGVDGSQQGIFSIYQELPFEFGIEDSKLFVFAVDAAQPNSRKVIRGRSTIDMSWHTIGVVYQKPKLMLYLDGKKEGEFPITLAPFRPFLQYAIGKSAGNFAFRGYLDDLIVTDFPLTEEQIQQYHQTLHQTLTLSGGTNVQCIITKGARKFTAALASVDRR